MILADENIPFKIIAALKENSIDVLSVYETNRGITYAAFIETARNSHHIILTEYKDFGEWVFAHGVDSISVLFLRYAYPDQTEITEILKNLINQRGAALFGMFVTITTEKLRYRMI